MGAGKHGVERTKHGLAVARAQGRVGGSKKRVSDEQVLDAFRRNAEGEPVAKLAKELRITSQALYRRMDALRSSA